MSEIIGELIASIRTGLSIWEHKEKTKYLDHLNDLEMKYYAATNLPESQQDHAYIDNLIFQLFLARRAFSATAGQTSTVHQ